MEEKKATILLVSADANWTEGVQAYLEQNQFEVCVERRGDVAVERIISEWPALVILDLVLPGMDGISVCREVRPRWPRPILVASSRDDDVDEVVSLEVGADDFIKTSIRLRNLLARIRNLLRRSDRTLAESGADTPFSSAEPHGLALDAQRRLAFVDGKPVHLTGCSYELLSYFFSNQGIILTREEINRQMRGAEWDAADRSIDLRISRLRSALGDSGRSPRFIKSVRGTGYMLLCQA
ncbi:MAG: response regulator transcription factor [Proteobacteria bacterium]|nr:response regulator transcription factor [Pseudomonadota bacterium]